MCNYSEEIPIVCNPRFQAANKYTHRGCIHVFKDDFLCFCIGLSETWISIYLGTFETVNQPRQRN
jgi:hypothetical protein